MIMDKFRGASNSLPAKILLTVIAVSFVLSGVAGYVFSRVDTSAVKVNGEEISQQAFQRQYNLEYQQLSNQLGAQFAAVADSPEFINGLRNSVLNNLINQELLRQYADELKLAVTDERIKQQIVSTPAFQVNGKFDNQLYQQMLVSNQISSDTYAHYVREGLELEQLQTGLLASDFLVPTQQQALTKLLLQRREVRLATLSLNDEVAKQNVSEQEIEDYYNTNKNAFLIPELVKVQYLDISRADIEKNIQVSDVEIAQYYQDHKADFLTQGQQRVAHIQLNNQQDADEVYQALQAGADFAQLAQSRSIDKLSGVNGGDLSWVVAGEFPLAFEQAADKLAVGEYSQPVKVDNSFHIIKILDRKAPSELPLEQVRGQIVDQIRQDLVSREFYQLEKNIAEKAFENPTSLTAASEIAQQNGVKLVETDYFSRRDIPVALNYPNVVSAIFDTDLVNGGENSQPINVGDEHSIVFRVIEHKAEGIESLADAKAKIENLLKRQKAEQIVFQQAEQLVKDLNANPSAVQNKVNFADKQTLTYGQSTDPRLNNAIFALSKPEENKAVYSVAKAGNGDVVIIELDKIIEGELDQAQQQAFNAQLAQAQQQELQLTLLEALRSKAKIEINDEFINQQQ